MPRVVTYAIHPAGIADVAARARERGEDPGPVSDLYRRTPDGALLEWRLTHPRGARPDVPFLIDWGSTPNPGTTIGPAVELLAFTQTAVDPAPTEAARAALGLPPGSLAELGRRPARRLRAARARGGRDAGRPLTGASSRRDARRGGSRDPSRPPPRVVSP